MTDEAVWKRRFLIFTLVRLSALLLVLLGLAVAASDVLVPGGSRVGGALIVALAIAEMMIVPRLLRKSWEAK